MKQECNCTDCQCTITTRRWWQFFGYPVEKVVTKEVEVPAPIVKNGWKFEMFKSPKNSKWYFRLRSSNGKVVASSRQAYNNKKDCVSTIHAIQKNAAGSSLQEVTKK